MRRSGGGRLRARKAPHRVHRGSGTSGNLGYCRTLAVVAVLLGLYFVVSFSSGRRGMSKEVSDDIYHIDNTNKPTWTEPEQLEEAHQQEAFADFDSLAFTDSKESPDYSSSSSSLMSSPSSSQHFSSYPPPPPEDPQEKQQEEKVKEEEEEEEEEKTIFPPPASEFQQKSNQPPTPPSTSLPKDDDDFLSFASNGSSTDAAADPDPPLPPPPPLSPPPPPPPPPSPPPPSPPPPPPPPPPTACMRELPCGTHASCVADEADPEQKFVCMCQKGYKGNPYSNGKDRCKNKEELYLENLFGYHKCRGCKFVPALRSVFRNVKGLKILDFGTGSCKALKMMIGMGMNATGVESASFALEDNCPELLTSGAVMKSKLDNLPFGNATFDVVFVSHVLEYMPKDILDHVIAEISRVSKLHVFVAIQTPDEKKKNKHKNIVNGLEVESYFSNLWWRERLAAGGLDLMDIETHMFLQYMKKKSIKLDHQEVVMFLGTEPEEASREFPLIHKVYCLACDYMPLASYMYSPPITVSQSRYKKKLTMGETMVLGPSSCSVMRGLLENPPSSLKRAIALQPVPYTIARDCPDLYRQRLVRNMPKSSEQLPFKSQQADLILSLFHLELMTEEEIAVHLEELKRVTKHRIFFSIHTCGVDQAAPNCLANAIPGIVTSKPRVWWIALLERHDFHLEDFPHTFQKRQCNIIDKVSNSSKMGYCNSVLEELSSTSTFELKLEDIFPVMFTRNDANSTKDGKDSAEEKDIGDLIAEHKAIVSENPKEDYFVDVKELKDNSEIDPFELEVKLTQKHHSKHYKEEQKIKERLRKLFPNGIPPAPRTAHIYLKRGYNIKAAGTQTRDNDNGGA